MTNNRHDQDRVLALLEETTDHKDLKKWVKGYIPKHYKRCTLSEKEMLMLAKVGAAEAMARYGEKLFFTQSVMHGLAITEYKKRAYCCTTSQYGKSFVSGMCALTRADKGNDVYVAGGTKETSHRIMEHTIKHLQNADQSIKAKITDFDDKIEKLDSSVSKTSISFKGSGKVQQITLGNTSNDPLKNNQAIGKGGDYILDEADEISDDVYAELGRSEVANIGKKNFRMEISNPHYGNEFYKRLTSENVEDDECIIWMDVRTAVEEGRLNKEDIPKLDFFKNESTCKRYLLCELNDRLDSSMFPRPIVNDEPINKEATFFLGVDSAYKGKDGIQLTLGSIDKDDIRVLDTMNLKEKGEWVHGITSVNIAKKICLIAAEFNVKAIAVDVGQGVWLLEELANRLNNVMLFEVNFGSSTNKERKKANHFSAKYGSNKRAEMHLDLQELMLNEKITYTSSVANAIRKQLSATTQINKANGIIAIEEKSEIKKRIGKSPDELDSTILLVQAIILYHLKRGVFLYE